MFVCASGITELKGLNSKLQRPEKKRRDGLKEDVAAFNVSTRC